MKWAIGIAVVSLLAGGTWLLKGRFCHRAGAGTSLTLGQVVEGALSVPLSAGCIAKGDKQGNLFLTVTAVPITCEKGNCGTFQGTVAIPSGAKGNLGGLALDSGAIERALQTDIGNSLISVAMAVNGKELQQALKINGKYLFDDSGKANMSLTVDASSQICDG